MSGFQGILPAVLTPFDEEGRFAPAAFDRLLARLYEAGVHGLYVCGQTGEGMAQPAEQRKQVAEAAVRWSPRDRTVIVHVGAASTAEAVDLARHAGRAGAHAISSLPPIGSYSFAEVKAYYQTLAAAAQAPLLIYYFPASSSAIATVDQVLELCAIPNVAGLKFTDSDLYRLWRIKRAGAVVFNGFDEMLVAGLLMGADGGIGSFYNVVPDLFVELYRLAKAGSWDRARTVQDTVNELISIGLRYPVHAAIKAMLRYQGLDCGQCLAPRRSLTLEEEADLRKRLRGSQLGESKFAALVS